MYICYFRRFFSDVQLPAGDKPSLKIPSKIKEPLRQAKEEFERRLKEEQKAVSVLMYVDNVRGKQGN